jgi:hypothetical protein
LHAVKVGADRDYCLVHARYADTLKRAAAEM